MAYLLNLSPLSIQQLIPPPTMHSPAQGSSSIYATLKETWMLFCEELEHYSTDTPEATKKMTAPGNRIEKMAPKMLITTTISTTTKYDN